MPKLRARTVSRNAAYYRGTAGGVPAQKVDKTLITVPADDPEGIDCRECGARVKALVSGRPRAHAPGGYTTNTRVGRYHCSGSGTHA